MKFGLVALMLSAAVSAANAEASPTWTTHVDGGGAVIYGEATDNVGLSIACNASDGSGTIVFFAIPDGLKEGEEVTITVSGPGGKLSFTGTAHLSEMDDSITVVVKLPSALPAIAPLSKPGKLTIHYPSNSYSIPVGPKAAAALKAFRSQCPRVKAKPG